jgi:hypothetical protein
VRFYTDVLVVAGDLLYFSALCAGTLIQYLELSAKYIKDEEVLFMNDHVFVIKELLQSRGGRRASRLEVTAKLGEVHTCGKL